MCPCVTFSKSFFVVAFQREAFIPVDSLIGGHPIDGPCWVGFPTRVENLVLGGLNHRFGRFSDREDDVCGFRGSTTLSSSARRMAPENGVSGFNGTLPSLRRSWSRSVRLQRFSRMAGSAFCRPDDHTLDDAQSRIRGEHGGHQPGKSATPQGLSGSR
jgi:hypothetical protein